MLFQISNFLFIITYVLSIISVCYSHGRLEIPAARNAAWRFGFNTPENYNDNELNCGGAGMQHSINGGKCGVCGDSYSGSRPHEVGGRYATGTIVKSYVKGTIIDVRVRLSANHRGNMEFRICPVLNKFVEITKECLDENLLHIIGHGTSYPVQTGEDEINLNVKLPDDLVCSHCVFQWKYRAGNSWGSLPNGTSGIGYGAQEEFYNCADIEIRPFAAEITSATPIILATKSTTVKKSTTVSVTKFSRTTPKTKRTTRIKTTKKISTTSPSGISTNKNPFFHCEKISPSVVEKLPKNDDPNEFNGIPLCLLIGDSELTCKDCYENCISPFKKCPKDSCYCRWYN
ncbi:unnamed protein product [Brachionus calyciflorus]|uniref:Chitin-binding type-4 domain-containing protein n=1 Tax=Brachionus calyciflorus TaxID=104777 RepID=A0A813S6G1_9BILA|nr:unnamed protein product [Brachionus calyciflorus]